MSTQILVTQLIVYKLLLSTSNIGLQTICNRRYLVDQFQIRRDYVGSIKPETYDGLSVRQVVLLRKCSLCRRSLMSTLVDPLPHNGGEDHLPCVNDVETLHSTAK